MDLCVNVGLLLRHDCAGVLIGLCKAAAQLPEILAGLWTDVIKQLYDNLLRFCQALQLV